MASDLPKKLVEDLQNGGLTYEEIETEYGIKPRSFRRRKNNENLPINGRVINPETGKQEFYIDNNEDFDPAETVNHTEARRTKTQAKQTITQKANEFLAEYENKIKNYRDGLDIDWPALSHEENREDIVIHRTDDHFGEIVHDIHGDEIFNSEIATQRINASFQHVYDTIDARRAMGHDIENAHILLGGDHVTNEAIYEGQQYEIDSFIDEQIRNAVSVYKKHITQLADKVDHVQIVCQAGNHGEFRVQGSSKYANADNIFYDILEMLLHERGLDNVNFVKSDRKDHVNFQMRGHKGHLRHGQHVRNHIGTSSPQSDWRSFLVEYDFDIAYRGHYHEHKIEHVNGVPVIMAPSIKPGGEYEGTLALFGEAFSYIHGVNESNPVTWIEYTRFQQ